MTRDAAARVVVAQVILEMLSPLLLEPNEEQDFRVASLLHVLHEIVLLNGLYAIENVRQLYREVAFQDVQVIVVGVLAVTNICTPLP